MKFSVNMMIIILMLIFFIRIESATIGDLAVKKSHALKLHQDVRNRCNDILPFSKLCDKAKGEIDGYCNAKDEKTDLDCDNLIKNLTTECNLSGDNIQTQCTKEHGYLTSKCGKQLEYLNSVCNILTQTISRICKVNYKNTYRNCSRYYERINIKCNRIYEEIDDLCEASIEVNYWNQKYSEKEFFIDKSLLSINDIKEFSTMDFSSDETKKIVQNSNKEKEFETKNKFSKKVQENIFSKSFPESAQTRPSDTSFEMDSKYPKYEHDVFETDLKHEEKGQESSTMDFSSGRKKKIVQNNKKENKFSKKVQENTFPKSFPEAAQTRPLDTSFEMDNKYPKYEHDVFETDLKHEEKGQESSTMDFSSGRKKKIVKNNKKENKFSKKVEENTFPKSFPEAAQTRPLDTSFEMDNKYPKYEHDVFETELKHEEKGQESSTMDISSGRIKKIVKNSKKEKEFEKEYKFSKKVQGNNFPKSLPETDQTRPLDTSYEMDNKYPKNEHDVFEAMLKHEEKGQFHNFFKP